MFTQKSQTALDAELQRFMPDEIVIPETKKGAQAAPILQLQGYSVTSEPYAVAHDIVPWFEHQFAQPFPTASAENLKGALSLLYTYLKRNNEQGLAQIQHLSFYKPEEYLMLDAITQRNLELVKNIHDGSTTHTLFSVLDRAVTPMGSPYDKKMDFTPIDKKRAHRGSFACC